MKFEFKSNCVKCGELGFNEDDRVWNEDESCYCACGRKLQYIREYNGKVNTVGFLVVEET